MVVVFWLALFAVRAEIGNSLDDVEDRCNQPMDPGPCQYFQLKWFWDPKYERCNEFHYGGCLGTKNRFNTKQECVKQCIFKEHNPAAIPDLCLLDSDPGHCEDERNGQWWYFFNAVTGVCEQFFYYGCGGNNNKFYSLYQCRKICGERLSPQIACDRCDVRTSICKQNSKYNYTCECREGFQKNVHGECEDIDECRQGLSECGSNAWCDNTIGSHKCECMAGYVGDGFKCTYVGMGKSVDDCSQCSKDASCKNGICQCKVGFKGDGFNCTDTNECLRSPSPCDVNAKCRNVEGSFICECLPGFAGNGFNCTKNQRSCLDKFSRDYQETCNNENWREHYYLDHDSKRCTLFWYDGCPSKSMNIFSDLNTCEEMCERSRVLTRAEICWDKFDSNYKNQCLAGEWQQRYYFDHASLTCRLFWYDGCQGSSRNMFDDLLTCQWLCEEEPRYNSKSCLQSFDEHYRDECNGGRWRQQFFYDKSKKRCVAFWYDGCKGDSENIFQDEMTCVKMCESPAKVIENEGYGRGRFNEGSKQGSAIPNKGNRKPIYVEDPEEEEESYELVEEPLRVKEMFETEFRLPTGVSRRPSVNKNTTFFLPTKSPPYHKPRHKGKEKSYRTKHGNNSSNGKFGICETANPCENGGTCQFDQKKQSYFCKCAPGWTNDNCTARIDFDPCKPDPCQNGATCAAKASTAKTSYECICMPGFGGINCESRPCDDDPCQNNGTCRTTRSSPAFFCDCVGSWGGKHCEIPIPKKQAKYGKNVQQLSSGQPEWIEELKRRAKSQKSAEKPIRTAKDKPFRKKMKDAPQEDVEPASSAELMAAMNSSEPMDLLKAQKAGQTGGEFTGEEMEEAVDAAPASSLIITAFLAVVAGLIGRAC